MLELMMISWYIHMDDISSYFIFSCCDLLTGQVLVFLDDHLDVWNMVQIKHKLS